MKNELETFTLLTQAGYGPYLDDLELIIQDACPGKELGFDAFFNGKDFIRPWLYTCEIKGAGTVGVWTESNDIEELIFNKIKDSLVSSGYRGNISFEFFYDNGDIYCHDPTSRWPAPCGSLQAKLIKNYSEVVYKVALSEDVRVETDSKYVSQITLATDNMTTWRPIRFPKELDRKVGFRRVVKISGEYYFVPGDSVVACALGEGNTAKAALEDSIETADAISCMETDYSAGFYKDSLEVIKETNVMKGNMKF